jgi:hypothetical protein
VSLSLPPAAFQRLNRGGEKANSWAFPSGMTDKKGKNNCNGKSRSFTAFRMTTVFAQDDKCDFGLKMTSDQDDN